MLLRGGPGHPGGLTIAGCACGWSVPIGSTNPDDEIAHHVAFTRHRDAAESVDFGIRGFSDFVVVSRWRFWITVVLIAGLPVAAVAGGNPAGHCVVALAVAVVWIGVLARERRAFWRRRRDADVRAGYGPS